MLSNKMTFSLMSLITIIALAFAVSPVMAGDFTVKIEGPGQVNYADGAEGTALDPIHLIVTSDQAIQGTTADGDLEVGAGSPLTLDVYDENGFTIAAANYTITITDEPVATYPQRTAKKRRLAVAITPGTTNTIASVIVKIAAFETPDNRVADADDMSKAVEHTILVREAAAATDTKPKVVSIQRLRPGSQTVVAAFQEAILQPVPFDVRIVFTEAWNVDLAKVADILEVSNGTASNVTAGTPFARVLQPDGGTGATPSTAAEDTTIPHPSEGMYEHASDGALSGVPAGVPNSGNVPMTSGADGMYHQYRVTITPHTKSEDFDIKISVKAFNDGGSPNREFYVPVDVGAKPNGREELRLRVKGAARNLTAGYKVTIPADWIIPANGYLVVARSKAGSAIDTSGQDADRTNDTPRATHRTPVQLLYNVYETDTLPNLATAFLNGVVVDVVSQHAGLVISEVMWGEDASLNPSTSSQYIELYNPGGQYKTIADKDETPDINEALTLIFYAPNEFSDVPAKTAVAATATTPASMALPAGITDRIGTLDAKGAYWSPASKGQSGRSGIPIERLEERAADEGAVAVEIIPTIATGAVVPIVSMYRSMVADTSVGAAADAMMAADGQMAANWMSSEGPKSANFRPIAIGVRHGTPGAATDATVTPADTEAEAKAKADAAAAAAKKTASTGTIPTEGQIYISEIMVAGGGTLPQWIEIANGSKSEENLSGWTLTIANAAADTDVSIGASAKFTIPDGTTIGAFGQQSSASTILVVTEAGRNNVDSSGQVINLMKDNEVELILAGVTKRKYTILSADAFSITLAPPEPAKSTPPAGETADAKAKRMAAEKQAKADRMEASDTVGNLGADGAAAWALPMSEDGRSSIIRRHVQVAVGPAEPEDGMMADSWVLASDTSFAQPTHIRTATYYGAMNDVGTPGFRAGGALPVELSHFRPVRNKETGQVVITWSTQSELNNAGFFIKRSQQKDGEFKVINATMIAGAGTTSEKQFYTYTDTTAQPNVVYYYQIEDVSLDGNRQTLTRGIRLKGHVSVAGKATITWGELKTSNE